MKAKVFKCTNSERQHQSITVHRRVSIKECSLVSHRNTHPGRDLRDSGGPTRKFPAKGSRLLPQDPWGIRASSVSEGVSNVSKCGQGDYS